MANITAIEPIRYTQDEIFTHITGLIKVKETAPIDLTKYKKVTKITVNTVPETFPESVSCAIAFSVDGGPWQRYITATVEGLDVPMHLELHSSKLPTQNLTADSLLEEGNTIAEVRQFIDDTGVLAGHKILYAIALKNTDPANISPKIALNMTCMAGSQTLVDVEYSPEYEYDEGGILVTEADVDSDTELGGTCEVTAQALLIDDKGEAADDLTEWLPVNELVGKKIQRVQYKAELKVLGVDTGKAILSGVKLNYRTGDVISTSGYSEIISVIRDWRRDLRHCRIYVKHAPLNESTITAYATFRTKSIQAVDEFLGYGEGARATYQFIHKDGIKLDSVQIYVDGVQVSGGFDINCEAGQINITAAKDSVITANYEYNYGSEEWLELEKSYTERFDRYDMSVYTLTIPEENSEDTTRSMAGIKIAMSTTKGSVEDEYIGLGTGMMASYHLEHPVRGGVLRVYEDGEAMSAGSYVIEEDPRYIQVAGKLGSELKVSYDWESESPIVYEIGGVFSL